MPPGELTIRPAGPADHDAIVDLAAAALGWDRGEPNAALFRWKHLEGPFGESPMWVADAGDRLAAFRTFLRWELVDPAGHHHRVVRAVDTATHPDFQRQGLFSRLTRAGLEALADDGVSFVFNTPNAQSRPGYLKLGWSDVGRLPVAVRPSGAVGAGRMLRSRVPAEKWSVAVAAGDPAPEVLAAPDLERLLDALPEPRGLATPRRADHLRWRYRFGPLHYRAVRLGPETADGVVVFRVRRRGRATEVAVADLLVPPGCDRAVGRALGRIGRQAGADYCIALGRPIPRAGLVPVPAMGPRLTARTVAVSPPLDLRSWDLRLGDIELF